MSAPAGVEDSALTHASLPDPQAPFEEERRGLWWLCEREVVRFLKQAILTAAFSNNSSTVIQARMDRFINDVLASPLRWWGSTSAWPSAASPAGCSPASCCWCWPSR